MSPPRRLTACALPGETVAVLPNAVSNGERQYHGHHYMVPTPLPMGLDIRYPYRRGGTPHEARGATAPRPPNYVPDLASESWP